LLVTDVGACLGEGWRRRTRTRSNDRRQVVFYHANSVSNVEVIESVTRSSIRLRLDVNSRD
jgi:hypothetical protein